MRLEIVLGLARAEARLIRRLVRYWVFVVLAAGLGLLVYSFIIVMHGLGSSYSASVGVLNPRYLVGGTAFYYLLAFIIGLILLAFDVRARDRRERIVEVLDSQPCTNLELLTGRFLGILVPAWLPVLGTVLLMELFGWISQALDWPVGAFVEPWSLVRFVVFMTIPTFAFVLATVFLVSLLVPNRFVTAVLILVLVGADVWLLMALGVDLNWIVDLTGVSGLPYPSDLIPQILTLGGYLQRLAVLVAACGLLVLAAAVHPRLDGGSRALRAGAGAGLVVVGFAVLGLLIAQGLGDRARFERWQAAHEERRDEPVADLEAISGLVKVDPGQALELELEVRLAAPPETSLERALFTLNPGLAVERIADGEGRDLSFSHRDGLLEVTLGTPLAAAGRTTLTMTIGGRPQTAFAYLDQSVNALIQPSQNNMMVVLGIEPAIFDRHFVALLPGIRWLPVPGADVGRDDPRIRTADFFSLDLTVELPEEWLAAGPGRRQAVEGAAAGKVRYRFAPPAPLPEAAIVASRFARRAAEVEGVEMEILLHPAHARNLEVFAEAGDEIREWLGERLREAAEIGLPYPYGALTLVEVPWVLRGYGGGWRMDTAMAPPAMVLVHETSFPTARFDFRFGDPEDFADREGGIAQAKREALLSFFTADFYGGNPLLGAARNFFQYQTTPRGPGAVAVGFICHDLTNRLVTGERGFFSAHVFGPEFQRLIQNTVANVAVSEGRNSVAETFFEAATDWPEVWDQALAVALSEVDPVADPGRTLKVLALKGDAMSRWILDDLGRRQAGKLLAELRSRTAGGSFDRDDLMAAAAAAEVDLETLLGNWLDETALAGFVASPAELDRLADSADGVPRYQLAVHVRNDEAAPGLLRVAYLRGGEEGNGRPGSRVQRSEPVTVGAGEAVEIGLVLAKPPRRVWIEPYLALNRHAFRLRLPAVDEEKIVDAEPLRGSRPSDWQLASEAIVVDDLDPGFRVEGEVQRSSFRLAARDQSGGFDQGLPVPAVPFGPPGQVWQRWIFGSAWGKYRHTVAATRAGRGDRRAVFTAELPHDGRWRLELSMPSATPAPGRWRRGTYHLVVVDSSDHRQELTFDAKAAETGWNVLDELELTGGEVRVELSNKTNGSVVIADAIRWLPDGEEKPPSASP
ncbi:MAG: hypothetical protein GY856_53660 [bacterium]|nr:hypothetical protein [bacterium]